MGPFFGEAPRGVLLLEKDENPKGRKVMRPSGLPKTFDSKPLGSPGGGGTQRLLGPARPRWAFLLLQPLGIGI